MRNEWQNWPGIVYLLTRGSRYIFDLANHSTCFREYSAIVELCTMSEEPLEVTVGYITEWFERKIDVP